MKNKKSHKALTLLISLVWLVNGLFCKVLNLVPRHEQIVAQILAEDYSRPLTILIGLSEVVMAVWVLSKFKSKLNAITQILVVALMNALEFILVPDLLLWGKLNSLFALLLIGLASTSGAQIGSYPYYGSSDLKNKAVTYAGGSAELEPLETGSMKDLPTKYELTKGLMGNGFKEKVPAIDSIEDKIKGASRNHGADEMR